MAGRSGQVWLHESMRTVWLGAVVTALLCAGCSGGGGGETVEVTTTDEAGRPTVVTQEVTEAPEPTGPDAAPATAALVSTVLDVPGGGRLAFDLPDTWRIEELGLAARTAAPDPDAQPPQQWCLVPDEELPAIDGCAGVLLAAGPDWLPGHAGAAYALRQQEGWRSTPEPLACPFDEDGLPADAVLATSTPDAVGATSEPAEEEPAEDEPVEQEPSEVDLLVTANDGLPMTSTETEVSGRTVRYETWRVTCSLSEGSISPQVWHDVDLRVLVRDYFGSPYSVAVVASLREA